MSEVWIAAAITVGGSVISGIGQEKKAKKDRENANADRKAATREEALYSGVLSSFEREQDDYYEQLGRQRKQRGLDTFRQFSTTNQFAPNMVSGDTNIVLPDKPNVANNIDAGVRQDQANQQVANAAPGGGGGKGGSSLVKKLVDPLGIF